MSELKRQRFCPTCNKNVLAVRPVGISDGMGCLLTVLTLGFFLPVFLLWRLLEALLEKYRCPACGEKL